MKNLTTILMVICLILPLSIQAQNSFEEYQLGEMPEGDNYSFVVRLKNDFAAENVVLNQRIRESIRQGLEYVPMNPNFDMPSYQDLLSALSEYEYIQEKTGLNIYVVESFNGFQEVAVYPNGNESLNEVLNKLIDSGHFVSIEHLPTSSFTEGSVSDLPDTQQPMYEQKDMGILGLITTNFYNDPHYPVQSQFGQQSNNSIGSHSVERALRFMRNKGIFSSNRQVNIAVIDEGYVPHEDIEVAEVFDHDFYEQGAINFFEGYIYVNHNKLTQERLDEIFEGLEGQTIYNARHWSLSMCSPDKFYNRDGTLKVEEGTIFHDNFEDCREQFENDDRYFLSFSDPSYFCFDSCDTSDWVRYEFDMGSPMVLEAQHGMWVASVIGAISNNGIGMSGIVPNNNLNLTLANSLKWEVGGFTGNIHMSALWASGLLEHPDIQPTQYPADIINMSLGGSSYCYSIFEEGFTNNRTSVMKMIHDNGTLIVSSAGNSNVNELGSPSNCSYVMSVAATNSLGSKTYFSNFGIEIDIAALGEQVVAASTRRVSGVEPNLYFLLGEQDVEPVYSYVNGTSFSAPIVSGLAGLLKLADPTLTPFEIRDLLMQTAKDTGRMGSCFLYGCGSGIVNVENAVRFLLDGEMAHRLEASHYLSNTLFANNTAQIQQMAQYGNTCNAYQITNGLNVKGDGIEYILLGSNGGDFVEIDRFERLNFSFQDDYEQYQVVVSNTTNGVLSEAYGVEVNRNTVPNVCI